MVFHFHGRIYTLGWAELTGLILATGNLATFVLWKLVKWWQRRSAVNARMRVRKRIEPVLQAYTVKILQYYVDNKQLPSIAELQQMQREAIGRTPEIWEIISQPRMRD